MIEVELKLQVDEFPDLSKLVCNKQKQVVDVYYDTADYKLISTGNFLRNRNNKNIDFKLNIGDLSHTYCKETNFSYDNFVPNDALSAIFDGLGIKLNKNFKNFEEFLAVNKLYRLAIIDKTRTEYKFEDLTISLDDAKDIGKFIEIEYDLPDDALVNKDAAAKYILDKMAKNKLLPAYKKVNIGYVELYLQKHNPKAFNLGLFKG